LIDKIVREAACPVIVLLQLPIVPLRPAPATRRPTLVDLRQDGAVDFAHRGPLVGQVREKPRILRHYRGGAPLHKFGFLSRFVR
jgi:hypothetical protein